MLVRFVGFGCGSRAPALRLHPFVRDIHVQRHWPSAVRSRYPAFLPPLLSPPIKLSLWRHATSASSTNEASPNTPPGPAPVKEEALKTGSEPKPSFFLESKRIFKLAVPEALPLAGAVTFLVISSGVSMSIPFSMGKIIDFVMHQLGLKAVDDEFIHLMSSVPAEYLFGGLVGFFAIGAGANFGRIILMRMAGERIIERLRNQIFDNIVRQDIQFFDKNRTGEIISRLAADTVIVGKSVTQNISDGLRNGIMAIVATGMMFSTSSSLSLTMMAIIPPVAVAAIYYGRVLRDISVKVQTATSQTTQVAQEKLDLVRTVRAFAQEARESKAYAAETHKVYQLSMMESYAGATFFSGAGFAGNFVAMAILYYGGSLVAAGQITPGDLTSFFLYSTYVGFSMMGLSGFYAELMKGIGASSRLFSLMESKGEVEGQSSQNGIKLENVTGRIEFRDVEFAYPTRPEAKIFKGLSFTIEPGTNVAIVGKSGSGKSTVAQLLLRFYDPSKGAIFIDGYDIRSLNGSHMRDNVMGLISQEPALFATTIRENIIYGRPNATQEEIEAAAERANALGFIRKFPAGFDTYAGEKGVAMSGGQKQRIAIARALLKNPKILIMDEATSALDASSEHLVQDSMEEIVLGRTVITIAHRLSTIQQADFIIVVEDGRVVETGPYDELVEREDGKFRLLVDSQLNN
ncbi:P-loop containing nucleoside triphosphate hydrolase protein [Chytriomyces sp. MP71]|nr:P-loop containing nucleoside triphosphate hydrolase protein [Chytriomyces sp. MP71]